MINFKGDLMGFITVDWSAHVRESRNRQEGHSTPPDPDTGRIAYLAPATYTFREESYRIYSMPAAGPLKAGLFVVYFNMIIVVFMFIRIAITWSKWQELNQYLLDWINIIVRDDLWRKSAPGIGFCKVNTRENLEILYQNKTLIFL